MRRLVKIVFSVCIVIGFLNAVFATAAGEPGAHTAAYLAESIAIMALWAATE